MGESNSADTDSRHRPADDMVFRGAILGVAAIAAFALIRLQFCESVSLPPKPPKPVITVGDVQEVTLTAEANPLTYKGYLKSDSEHYRIASVATLDQMSAQFAYQVEQPRHEMKAGDKGRVEFAGLGLTMSLRRVKGSPRKLMVLTVENLSDQYVAYRIKTVPSAGTKVCQNKHNFSHNAMVLEPNDKIERTECTFRKGWDLEIRKVETLAIPPLSYHYISRVPPSIVGIENRVSRGHRIPEGKPCQVILSARIRSAQRAGTVLWRDLVDYYARHRCDTYRFPDGYKAFETDGAQTLPVMPKR